MKRTMNFLLLASLMLATVGTGIAIPVNDQAQALYFNLKNGKSTEAIYTYCQRNKISTTQIVNETKKICEANNDWDTYAKATELEITWEDRKQSISTPVKIIAALGGVATGVCIWLLYTYLKKPARQIPPVIPPVAPTEVPRAVHPQPRPNLNPVAMPRPNPDENIGAPVMAAPANRPAAQNQKNAPTAFGSDFGKDFGRGFGRKFANPAAFTPEQERKPKAERVNAQPRAQNNNLPAAENDLQTKLDALNAQGERIQREGQAARAALRAERERMEEEIQAEDAAFKAKQAREFERIDAQAAEYERNRVQEQARFDAQHAEDKKELERRTAQFAIQQRESAQRIQAAKNELDRLFQKMLNTKDDAK